MPDDAENPAAPSKEQTTRQPVGRVIASSLVVLAVASAVTGAVYLVADHHTPDYTAEFFGRAGRDGMQLKAWLGSGLLGLAVVQLGLAAWIYRALPGLSRTDRTPRAVSRAHRTIGVVAFALSVPIAVHCITAYGIEMSTTRTAIHSVSGCALYGAFAAKVLVVRNRSLPGWLLPIVGGLLVVTIAVLWYSAPLWFFNEG